MNHPIFASLTVGSLLMLGQIAEQVDNVSQFISNGGAIGFTIAAMLAAYKLVAKAQKDALTIREESFDDSVLSSKAMLAEMRQSLEESKEQFAREREFFNVEITKLREERISLMEEISQLKVELVAARSEIAALREFRSQ